MVKTLICFCVAFAFILVIQTIINLRNFNDLDIYYINEKRNFYPPFISRIFQNKLTEAFWISRKEIFSYLNTDNLFAILYND